jgi:hypothetical protein
MVIAVFERSPHTAFFAGKGPSCFGRTRECEGVAGFYSYE